MLTSKYPFGEGEEFIETEIDYISRVFKEVIIITGGIGEVTRRVPTNCKVLSYRPTVADIGKYEKLKALQYPEFYYLLAKAMNKKSSPKELYCNAMNEMRNTSRIIRYVEYISGVIRKAETKDIEITLYSYWMSFYIIVQYHLKKIYPMIKTAVRAHNTDLYEFFNRFESRYPLRHTFRKVNALFFISEHGEKYFKKRFGIIRSGLSSVSRLGVKAGECIVESPVTGSIKIITVSSLIKIKRVDRIIAALALLKTNVKWVHIGSGPLEIDLKRMAEKFFEGHMNIEYEFKGYMKNDDLKSFYKEFKPNLLLNTSEREGIPVSIMEAMSMGVPVIAMNTGGCSEIVDSKNGKLLPKNSTNQDISNAIQEICSMGKNDYLLMSKSAYSRWYSKFNSEKNYKEFAYSISSFSKD